MLSPRYEVPACAGMTEGGRGGERGKCARRRLASPALRATPPADGRGIFEAMTSGLSRLALQLFELGEHGYGVGEGPLVDLGVPDDAFGVDDHDGASRHAGVGVEEAVGVEHGAVGPEVR